MQFVRCKVNEHAETVDWRAAIKYAESNFDMLYDQ